MTTARDARARAPAIPDLHHAVGGACVNDSLAERKTARCVTPRHVRLRARCVCPQLGAFPITDSTMHAIALAPLLALATGGTLPVDIQRIDVPATLLELDGQWYPLPAGSLVLRADGAWHALQSLPMQDCTRPGGADQAVTSVAWRWTNGLRTIYLDPEPERGFALKQLGGSWVVALRSATGDVTCAGAGGEPGVFGSGFE